MKVEMGESLVISWLKHAKKCQIVQGNWKVSMKTWNLENEEMITEIIRFFSEYYLENNNFQLFKSTTSVKQIIKQGEIDVLGVSIHSKQIENLYAIDVAFHEGGLNYTNRGGTEANILKKLVRMICTVIGYFDVKNADVIFATPKMSETKYSALESEIENLQDLINSKWDLDFNVRLIANKGFKEEIFDVVSNLASDVADTSELYMRAIQMYNLMNKN